MRFRRPNGTTAKLTLGPVDLSGREADAEPQFGAPLTLAAARRLAAEVQRLRALGRDVLAEIQEQRRKRHLSSEDRQTRNFGALAKQFVAEHARVKTRRWKETARLLGFNPDNLEMNRGGLARLWRDRSADEISADDIHALVRAAFQAGVPGLRSRNQGASEARARALYSCLSKLFSWLVANRLVTTNPCKGLARPSAPPPRDRILSDAEIRSFWNACEQLGTPFGPLFQILLILGARRDEVSRMTYRELTTDGMLWKLDGSRTKNRRPHSIPLPPHARERIANVPRIRGADQYVFSTNGRTPVSGFSKAKSKLDREMRKTLQDLPAWRVHDLRRTAATGMARAGVDLHVIERALNHVSGSFGGIVSVYQRHRYEDEVKAALEAWENLVLSIVGLEAFHGSTNKVERRADQPCN